MAAWSTVLRGWAHLALKRGRLSAAVPGMADQWERASARAQPDEGVRLYYSGRETPADSTVS